MIVIVGAGIVGLALTAALGQQGFQVTLIENKQPILEWDPAQLDAKVSAINMASHRILKNLGVWQNISTAAVSPLKGLRVWDATRGGEIFFDSRELGVPQLGFIVENRALIKLLWEKLQSLSNVLIKFPAIPEKIIEENNKYFVVLQDESKIAAEIIVGADGSESWVREQMKIVAIKNAYQQEALTAVLETEKPHQALGWQNFLPTGPLGVLPLQNPHQVAMVWSNNLSAAERLKNLEHKLLNEAVSKALDYRLGEMTLLTSCQVVPLIMRRAEEYVRDSLVLIGDAAHTIHPLAGQGVNLGLMDVAVLTEILEDTRQKGQPLGSVRALSRYQRWRKGDNTLMLTAMTGFKELFGSQNSWLMKLRSQGLNFTNQVPWLKNSFMRYAMGERGNLPRLARPQ